jgi:hypothetical protein
MAVDDLLMPTAPCDTDTFVLPADSFYRVKIPIA